MIPTLVHHEQSCTNFNQVQSAAESRPLVCNNNLLLLQSVLVQEK